ncbi:MAG: hypothetical protein IJP24_04180 [Firmicutes bacterium]|nr:hypothetical protein [Bacillota bacterium]MBQ3123392.1 hypothetical protein [Bacillota bacterium]MBQ9972703.1 hypothetical protein [Bacillota bacterium]
MVITELIKQQAFETVVMLGGGTALGMLYGLNRYFRERIKRIYVKDALEIIFFIFSAFFITKYLKYASDGALTFHSFLAMTLGVLLWKRLFYGKIKS